MSDENLSIELDADASAFISAMQRSREALEDFKAHLSTVESSLIALGTAFGVKLTFDGVKQLAMDGIKAAAAMSQLARELGTTADEMSVFKFLTLGEDTEKLKKALLTGRDNFKQNEKFDPDPALARHFDGPSKHKPPKGKHVTGPQPFAPMPDDGNERMMPQHLADIWGAHKGGPGGDAITAFDDFRRGFQAIASPAEQAAAIVKRFGAEGESLVHILLSTDEELAKTAEEARALGLVIGDEAAVKAEMAEEAFRRWDESCKAASLTIGTSLAPYLNKLIDLTLEWLNKSGGLDTVINKSLEWMAQLVGDIADAVASVEAAWRHVQSIVTEVLADMLEGFGRFDEAVAKMTGLGGHKRWVSDARAAAKDLHKLADQQEKDAKRIWAAPSASQRYLQHFKDFQSQISRDTQAFREQRNREQAVKNYIPGAVAAAKKGESTGSGRNTTGVRGSIDAFRLINDNHGDASQAGFKNQLKESKKQTKLLQAVAKLKPVNIVKRGLN
jgi:hypothetical protein